jgi:PAS domain S-box-containing protein
MAMYVGQDVSLKTTSRARQQIKLLAMSDTGLDIGLLASAKFLHRQLFGTGRLATERALHSRPQQSGARPKRAGNEHNEQCILRNAALLRAQTGENFHQCPMADVLRTGVSVREQEVHIERPDGSRGIALVDIEAVKDSGGNIVGAVNCFQDITERKLGEEATLRLAAIIASSDDAIISKDLDGTITSWNGGAERIFGYLAAEIIGKSIMILIPPDRQKEEETILGRIGRGERVEQYQTVRQHKDGSLIHISLSISQVRNAQGKVIGVSKIARDITEHKRSEAQIINLAREAEHRTKNILSTVLATVRLSHSDTSDDLKQLIEGRIDALAKVHGLFVQERDDR